MEGGEISARAFYTAYIAWGRSHGVTPISETAFGRQMSALFPRIDGRVRRYLGIEVVESDGVARRPVKAVRSRGADSTGNPSVEVEKTLRCANGRAAVDDFVRMECVLDPNAEIPAADFIEAFQKWSSRLGRITPQPHVIGRYLSQAGFPRRKSSTTIYGGLRLAQN
ncbi:MAG: hypothetical protein EON58_16240 [Alphaproteobacteria bacterium]|nr:MAG: hypothetical protein EON58_16240 [Alphaproteobacteria bacterium]